jgi:hypothetical protein
MNAGAMIAIMAASAAAAAQQRQLDGFRLAGATSPERARPLEAMGLPRDDTFARLVKEGVLHELGDGRAWLDEAALIARRSAVPRRGARIVLVAMVALTAILAFGALMLARERDARPTAGELR